MKVLHGFSDNKYEFLSNFAACDVFYANDINPKGSIFKTAEHAFQAAKATTIADMMYVAAAPTPGQAKRRGREIALRPDWESIKDQVMLDIVRSKFTNPDMRWRMLQTIEDGIDEFCEDNWWHDNYWGDCRCDKCCKFNGRNRLGKILTQVRQEIVDKENKNVD